MGRTLHTRWPACVRYGGARLCGAHAQYQVAQARAMVKLETCRNYRADNSLGPIYNIYIYIYIYTSVNPCISMHGVKLTSSSVDLKSVVQRPVH